MKKYVLLFSLLTAVSLLFLTSCEDKSEKSAQQIQHLDDNVTNPSTIEEIQDAIDRYGEKVAELQLAQQQVGIWYKLLGTRYLDNKMYGEAMKAFEQALTYYPDNQNLYYYVGVCAGYMAHTAMDFNGTGSLELRYNYLKTAEDAYLRAIQIDSKYTRALYGIGVLYVFELDESHKAIPHLEKLVSLDSKNYDAMFVLARAYYSSYMFDKAAAMYDTIAATAPDSEKKQIAEANKRIVLDASY